MSSKKAVMGFAVGLILWYFLFVVVNLVTRNGSLMGLTWLTEFGNKIWLIKFSILTSGMAEAEIDKSFISSPWLNSIAKLVTPLIYGLAGTGIVLLSNKKTEKKGNGNG